MVVGVGEHGAFHPHRLHNIVTILKRRQQKQCVSGEKCTSTSSGGRLVVTLTFKNGGEKYRSV